MIFPVAPWAVTKFLALSKGYFGASKVAGAAAHRATAGAVHAAATTTPHAIGIAKVTTHAARKAARKAARDATRQAAVQAHAARQARSQLKAAVKAAPTAASQGAVPWKDVVK